VLVNPVLTPLGSEQDEGWEGCLSVPGMRGLVPRFRRLRYQGFDAHGAPIDRTVEGFHAASCSTRSITSTASCFRNGCGTCATSAFEDALTGR